MKKLILFILLACVVAVQAAEPNDLVYWNGGTGLWMNQTNWTDDPGAPDWVVPGLVNANPYDWNKGIAVVSSGTAQITSASAPDGRVEGLRLGGSGGASVDIAADVEFYTARIGLAAGESGTINQTAGGVVLGSGGLPYLGDGGAATYNLSGGSLTLPNNAALGVNGGSFELNQTGGSFLANKADQHFYLGRTNSSAQLNIEGGSLAISAKEVYVGTEGDATINISGAGTTASLSTNNGGNLFVAKNSGTSGTINVQSGTLNINSVGPNGAILGYSGNALINQTGGTMNVTAPRFYVGWSASSAMNFTNGAINVSGGTTYGSYAIIGRGVAGNTSTLNMSGGTFTLTTEDAIGMTLGYYGQGGDLENCNKGMVNLSGGMMTLNAALNIGWSGLGEFNQFGGMFRADSVDLSHNSGTSYQASSLNISGGSFDSATFVETNMSGDVISVLGSDATKIEMGSLGMAEGSTLSIGLDADGSELIRVVGLAEETYHGASLVDAILQIDTLAGFDGQIGDVYDLLWSVTTIDITGLALDNLSSTNFSYAVVDATGTGYPVGQLLQLTVVPEPATMILLSIGGLVFIRRK